MALEGTIKEFCVTDILQLMAQQQKTGILIVESRDASVEVLFFNGTVVATQSPGQEDRIAEMLEKSGLVSGQRLQEAREKQKETFESFGLVLLREGFLSKEQLEKIILAQVYETLCEVLQWREGTYRFVPQNVREESGIAPLPGLESILLDVLRMIDEWPEVHSVVHSMDMVFAVCEGRTAEELDEDELTLYRLIDGKSPVSDIAAGSLMGRFAACKVLCGLVQDGFIELAAHQPRAARKKKKPASDTVTAVASYACLALLLAAALFVADGLPGSLLPFLSPAAHRDSLPQRWLSRTAALRLESAAEVYKLAYGAYPSGIDALVQTGLLAESRAQALSRRGITYTRTHTRYSISAEGIEGTSP